MDKDRPPKDAIWEALPSRQGLYPFPLANTHHFPPDNPSSSSPVPDSSPSSVLTHPFAPNPQSTTVHDQLHTYALSSRRDGSSSTPPQRSQLPRDYPQNTAAPPVPQTTATPTVPPAQPSPQMQAPDAPGSVDASHHVTVPVDTGSTSTVPSPVPSPQSSPPSTPPP